MNWKVCCLLGRNPHIVAMTLHWEGKECLLAFTLVALFLSPQNQVSGHMHMHQIIHFFFTEWKKAVEDISNALSSVKAIREEAKMLKERADVLDKFYEERKMATAK